jgi:hypothetical protein
MSLIVAELFGADGVVEVRFLRCCCASTAELKTKTRRKSDSRTRLIRFAPFVFEVEG